MSKIEICQYNNNFDYFIKFSDNTIGYFSIKDVIKSYSISILYDKINKEIVIIKYFLITLKDLNNDNKYFIKVLESLLTEAYYIINNFKIEDFNESVINKCYIILKYSSVIRNNINIF